MIKILDWFERIVIYILIVLMMAIIIMTIVGFGFLFVTDLLQPSVHIPNIDQFLDLFGYILLVLIGVELLDTIRAYLSEQVVHVEVVLEVALIAVARKIIIMELKEIPSATLFGIAALVAALAAAFYLEKRGRKLTKKVAVTAKPE